MGIVMQHDSVKTTEVSANLGTKSWFYIILYYSNVEKNGNRCSGFFVVLKC